MGVVYGSHGGTASLEIFFTNHNGMLKSGDFSSCELCKGKGKVHPVTDHEGQEVG
jgi:hypothetical protein